MNSRVDFWRSFTPDDNVTSQQLFEFLIADLPMILVEKMLRTLAFDNAVCADVPGAHLHINYVGYDDWFMFN